MPPSFTEAKPITAKQKGVARVKKIENFMKSVTKEQAATLISMISQTPEGKNILTELENGDGQ